MANIKTADSLLPSKVNTPLDARSRVATEADILNIEAPAIGQLVYCLENGRFYVVTALQPKVIGAATVADLAVKEYREFGSDCSLSDDQKNELLDELEDRLLNGEWGTV